MNRTKHFALLLFAVCFCDACTPYLYVPGPLNMPLAGNKGEFKGNVYFCSPAIGLQASYAVDSHCVVLVNVAGASAQPGSATYNDVTYNSFTNNFQGDIGAGYFKKFSQYGRFEVLGGFGYGGANSQNVIINSIIPVDYTINSVNGGFVHLFGQADIGLVKKNFEFGLGLRLSNLNPSASYQSAHIDQNNVKAVQYYDGIGGDALFLEPCAMIAFGFEKIKFNATLGLSNKLFGDDINGQYGSSIYQNLTLSFGISFNLKRSLKE